MTNEPDTALWMPQKPPASNNTLTNKKPRSAAKQVIKQPVAKAIRPATRKQKELARIIGTEPKTTHRDAYKAVYKADNMTDGTIDSEVYKTLRKPAVRLELDKYNDYAKSVVLEVIEYSKEFGKQGGKDGASYAGHALAGANSLIDRVDGKATQRTESVSKIVTLNIDLTTAVTEVGTEK